MTDTSYQALRGPRQQSHTITASQIFPQSSAAGNAHLIAALENHEKRGNKQRGKRKRSVSMRKRHHTLDKKSVQAGVTAGQQVVVIAERGRVRGALTRRHAVRRAGPASYTLVACVAPHAASSAM